MGGDGMFEFAQFERFGQYLSLDQFEVRIVFHKIDKKEYGQIHMDQIFEWFKKKLTNMRKRRKSDLEFSASSNDKMKKNRDHRRRKLHRKIKPKTYDFHD